MFLYKFKLLFPRNKYNSVTTSVQYLHEIYMYKPHLNICTNICFLSIYSLYKLPTVIKRVNVPASLPAMYE